MTAAPISRRAAGAVGVLLLLLVSIAGGMLFAKAEIDAMWSAVDAKSTDLEELRKRLQPSAQVPGGPEVKLQPFMEGATYALAANALQQRVVGLVEGSGGKLVTVGVDPADTADDEAGRRVTIQAVVELGNDGLQELLYRLEAEQPFVFVDSLSVAKASARGAADGDEGQKVLRLAVDLRVSGFHRRAPR